MKPSPATTIASASSCSTVTRMASRSVVRRGGAPRRESAVAAARTTGDLPHLVEANAHAALGERQRARAAGDTATDHDDLRAPPGTGARETVMWLLQPKRGRAHDTGPYVQPFAIQF